MDQDTATYEYKSGAQGLLVVNIDANKGIKKEILISHIDSTDMLKKRDAECLTYTSQPSPEQCYTLRTTGEKICTKPVENPIPIYCYNESDDSAYLASQMWNYSLDFVQRGLYIGDRLFTVSANHIQSNVYGSGYGVLRSVFNK